MPKFLGRHLPKNLGRGSAQKLWPVKGWVEARRGTLVWLNIFSYEFVDWFRVARRFAPTQPLTGLIFWADPLPKFLGRCLPKNPNFWAESAQKLRPVKGWVEARRGTLVRLTIFFYEFVGWFRVAKRLRLS